MEISKQKNKADIRNLLLDKSIAKITKRVSSSYIHGINSKSSLSPVHKFLRRSNNNTPTFRFSQLPRFDTQPDSKAKCIFHLGIPASRVILKKHLDTPKNFKSAIQINKNMKPFSPAQKVVNLRLSNMKFKARRSVNRLAKSAIFNMKKEIKEIKYIEKFRKLSLRQKQSVFYIQEFPMIQKGWSILCICAGMNKIFREKIKKYKVSKGKVKLFTKVLLITSKFIGKLTRGLKLYKRNLALAVNII